MKEGRVDDPVPNSPVQVNDIEISERKNGGEEDPSMSVPEIVEKHELIDESLIYFGPILPKHSAFFDLTTVSQEQIDTFVGKRLEVIVTEAAA